MLRETVHIPVLLNETLEYLRAADGGRFLDCTLGGGGHSRSILEANVQNAVFAVDRDPHAIARTNERLAQYGDRFCARRGRFSDLLSFFGKQSFNGILADLGISTDQLREERGFAFDDSTIDMRMDPESPMTAGDIVNHAEFGELLSILRRGGVGKEAATVAKAIVGKRPFESTRDLCAAVNSALSFGSRGKKFKNPSTVVLQALRIEVNDELRQIKQLMEAIPQLIRSGGRCVVIAFHSLEDKLVARQMREWASGGEYSALWPGAAESRSLGKLLTRKAVVPGEQEVSINPSSRSARLRSFEFGSFSTQGESV